MRLTGSEEVTAHMRPAPGVVDPLHLGAETLVGGVEVAAEHQPSPIGQRRLFGRQIHAEVLGQHGRAPGRLDLVADGVSGDEHPQPPAMVGPPRQLHEHRPAGHVHVENLSRGLAFPDGLRDRGEETS